MTADQRHRTPRTEQRRGEIIRADKRPHKRGDEPLPKTDETRANDARIREALIAAGKLVPWQARRNAEDQSNG